MILGMIDRVFLGWDQPFLDQAVSWLLARRDDLPGMSVVVPTAQGGRRLREAMAEACGALLSPRVVTPGSLLKGRDDEAAPDWAEHLAWVEVLEGVDDWENYTGLFPEPPDRDGKEWAGGLAREMVKLRHSLQENGILLAIAAQKLGETVEAERWEALGRLEDLVERRLEFWRMTSRSAVLADGLEISSNLGHLVLAGVVEMPPLVERALLASSLPVTVLVGAPEHEAGNFNKLGRPNSGWGERTLPWPNGSIHLAADPRQQAVEALRQVADATTSSEHLALGTADTEVGDELARAFTREGWPAFHPAAATVSRGLSRWLKVWSRWLADPTLVVMSDLLSLPETGVLVGGRRAQKAQCLAKLRDQWMAMRPDDLRRRTATESFRKEWEKEAAQELCEAAEGLEKWRASFLADDFVGVMDRLLGALGRTGPSTLEATQALSDWLAGAAGIIAMVRRTPGFWIELMLADLPAPAPLPPEGRVVDVQGWLELFHEPGKHLVLCGMNDGKVPARSGGEPWLSEQSRERLGLITDAGRAARDAFLYQSMLESRRIDGRVDVICGKSSASGDSLLPSRLLLAAAPEDLPDRVKLLFQQVEPPEAGLRWEKDWQWAPRKLDPPKRLSATSLGDYLICPFRYYLKHVVRMSSPDVARAEWNARDFGNVAHEVLERWGRDLVARESTDAVEIHQWLCDDLDRVVAHWFDKQVPLAVRIQKESLRQRFQWFAEVQALQRAEGWRIIDVERELEIPVGDAVIRMKIDRIDQHDGTGMLRVLDYKTGSVDAVEKAHRKKLTESTVLPAHYTVDDPVIHIGEEKGKSVNFRWYNLQLPLYAVALDSQGEGLSTPCYFTLGETAAEVAVREWKDFGTEDLTAAKACAEWVAERIAAGCFWPPAEKSAHRDFDILVAGRGFEEMFTAVDPAEASANEILV